MSPRGPVLLAVGVAEGRPRVGCLPPCCVGRLVSGAVPPPAARPLERAARVPRPVCPGCGRSGCVDPAPAPQRAPLRAGVARCGGGGRASPGGVPSTVVRGAWCQALSLPRPPVLWSGQPGFRNPCVPGAVDAGVWTLHRPHSVRPCGPALLAVGVAEGRPRGGVSSAVVLPCNIESMTGKAAAKWCAQTWMGGWDVPSEVVTDSGKEYTSEWWKELCARLGIHHLRCEIHSHRALPGERAGRSIINMLRKELASEKDFHWLEVLFALLRRYHNTPLYHGLSPNEIVFGRKKCWWNMPLNNPRPCKDASLFLDGIQRAEKTVSKLIDKHQAFCTERRLLWLARPSISIKLTGFGSRIKAEKTPTILKSMIEFGFENPKPPWAEMISFFPCGRGHSLLQRV